jgi:hypothetical protein
VSDRRNVHPRELLSAYLDGELAQTERAEVEAHLADCSSCGALLDDFRAMAAIATREEPPPVPTDLRSRIRLKVGLAGAHRTRPRRFEYSRMGLAAAAVIVLAIGLWATRWDSAPPQTPPIERPTAPDTLGGGERAGVGKEPRAERGAPAQAELDESLKALGYIGNGSRQRDDSAPSATGRNSRMQETAAPSAAPAPVIAGDVREREPIEQRQAKPERVPAAPAAGFAPAAAGVAEGRGARQDVLEDHKVVARNQAVAPLASPRSVATGRGQVLLLESTGYRVSAHQDGTVVLSAEGYTCAVRQDGPSVDPDIAALFALAATAGETAGSPSTARRGTPVVRLLKPPSAEEESAGEAPGADLPGAQGVAIETGLRTLLRDKYLPLMERRCGTVPRIVRSP